MRRLERPHERAFALRVASDPKTALAHFDVEIGGASVLRTSDSRCFLVAPNGHRRQAHLLGAGVTGDLLDELARMPVDTRLLASSAMLHELNSLVEKKEVVPLALYTGPSGKGALRVPPPRLDFDVRTVLHSDVPAWEGLPEASRFLVDGYGDARSVLARGAAVGAFNGRSVGAMATAELGRTFARIQTYTHPEHRGKGLAGLCAAELMETLRPTGERPLMVVASEGNGGRRFAEDLGLERAGELKSFLRRDMRL